MIRRVGVLVAVALLFGGLAVAPAAADKPLEFEATEEFFDFNPCTGDEMFVTIIFLFHPHEGHPNNFTGHATATGSTSDGYTMIRGSNQTTTANRNVFTTRFNDIWTNGEGSKFKASGVFIENKGEVQVDRFSLRCIGAETIPPPSP